ncbi:MAG: hypothetical protein JSR97_03460 [Verrucomicrobia bacterium]|nr:hypothetical protein [Verrucomicrobiota bacterium]
MSSAVTLNGIHYEEWGGSLPLETKKSSAQNLESPWVVDGITVTVDIDELPVLAAIAQQPVNPSQALVNLRLVDKKA